MCEISAEALNNIHLKFMFELWLYNYSYNACFEERHYNHSCDVSWPGPAWNAALLLLL